MLFPHVLLRARGAVLRLARMRPLWYQGTVAVDMLSVRKLTGPMSWGGLVGSVGLLGTAARLGRLPE